MTSSSLLGRFDLTEFSVDPEIGGDGLVAEISAFNYFSKSRGLYSVTIGGSDRVSVIDWSNPSDPELVEQKRILGYETASVIASKSLIAVGAAPSSYGTAPSISIINFFKMNSDGQLLDLGGVDTGFLTDNITLSRNGKKIFAANEGEVNDDYTIDPVGSISIISLNRKSPDLSPVVDITLPELNDSSISLLGDGIRFSGKAGVTNSFGQDAEPEYLAEVRKYLFVTLQESNAVARINLRTNQVEAYIGLGVVDYSQVSVDLDDKDGGFNPIGGQDVVGLRMPDMIDAWKKGKNIYFITANEGDSRDREDFGYIDESRNKDLGYLGVPDRLKLIVDGNDTNEALILNILDDSDPANDFTFESGSRTGTPVSFGSRSLSLFDGITGELLWDSWMTDTIKGIDYNTSLQNIAEHAGIYPDGRSDDKGVEPEAIIVVDYKGRRYAVGSLERTTAGDKTGSSPDPVTQGGLLVVYDVTNPNDVDFVTYQQVSRSPEGLEIIRANQNPTGRLLLGVSSEFDSNSVELFDFGALLNNGNGAAYLASDLANPALYATL
jgi:hypothetical protein